MTELIIVYLLFRRRRLSRFDSSGAVRRGPARQELSTTKYLGGRSKVAFYSALTLSCFLGSVYLFYGHVTPCGILKQKFKTDVAHLTSTVANPFSAVGVGSSLALGNNMIDGMFNSLTLFQCVSGLANYDEIIQEALTPKKGELLAK